MNINCKKGLHIGADGCRCGWIAAVLDYGELRIERYKSILRNSHRPLQGSLLFLLKNDKLAENIVCDCDKYRCYDL